MNEIALLLVSLLIASFLLFFSEKISEYFNLYDNPNSKKIHIYSNRGASGIDGIISSALGMCNNSNNKNSLLLIGDVSFYHDMNGLLASKFDINLTIVVINNSGGGIFSFLPFSDIGIKKFANCNPKVPKTT